MQGRPVTAEGAASNGALRLALQRSEGRRLAVLLALVLVTFGVGLVRHLAHGRALGGAAFPPTMALVGLTVAYAFALLVVVRRANARGELLPVPVWAMSVVFESLVPTAAILILQLKSALPPLEALTAPALVQYGTLILLDLRMRPRLCVLSGLVSAAGHVGLFLHAAGRRPAPVPPAEYPYYLSYGVYLLLMGVAAAVVTHRGALLLPRVAPRGGDAPEPRSHGGRDGGGPVDPAGADARGIARLQGFDIAGWNRPAEQTGGDYYDWQLAPGRPARGPWPMSRGHGVGPALGHGRLPRLRPRLAAGVRALSALGRVNDLLHRDVSEGRFVTLATAVLCATGAASCSRPATGRSSSTVPSMRAPRSSARAAPPSGSSRRAATASRTGSDLAPGDVLLFTTDGFVESRRADGQLYETERLCACLRANATQPAKELIRRLEADVTAFAGGVPQADDMTAVAIRRT